MSNKKLGQLAIIAAVMVVWAILQSHLANRPSAEPSGPAYLIQGVEPAEIESVTLGYGDDIVTIAKKEGRFVVTNKGDYPADAQKLNDLLTKAFDLKTSELYTASAKNHEDLEITEEKARSVIKFFKADGSLMTGIIVGKSAEGGNGAYVRSATSDKVYLVDSAPWFRSAAVDYLKQEIVEVAADDVNSVTVTTPGGAYTLRPAAAGDAVVMADLPAGKTLKTSDAKSVLNALTSLRFDDVNAPSTVEGLFFDHRYVCRLDNTTEYTLELAKGKDDKTYLRCSAAYFGEKVTINPAEVDSEEERKEKEARLLAEEHYQRFNLRHKDWIYQIPEWKAKHLLMAQADLFEDDQAKEETSSETPVLEAPVKPSEVVAPEEAPAVTTPEPVVDEPNEVSADPNTGPAIE